MQSEAERGDSNAVAEPDSLEELLRFASREPRAVFEGKLSEVAESIANGLKELLVRKDARDDPIWVRACGARPTRGALLRISRAAGVEIHPDNQWVNYKNFEEFRTAVVELKAWYMPGRRASRRPRRGIVRTEGAADMVVGRRSVWSKKVDSVYMRMLDDLTLEGLWHWREVAAAMHNAELDVFSATTPVERLWGNAESFFEDTARRIQEPWFNFLSQLAFLRYNYRHFHHQTLPTWTRGDSLLAERADLLWEIGRGLLSPDSWPVAKHLAAAFEEVSPPEVAPGTTDAPIDSAHERNNRRQQDDAALLNAVDVTGVLPLDIWTFAPLADARRECELVLAEELPFRGRPDVVAEVFDGAQMWTCLQSIRSRIITLASEQPRDVIARLLRMMAATLGSACTDLVRVADSTRLSSIMAPAGHCRVLESRWCEAVAQGHKFVEFVAYKKKWTNMFKFAERGHLLAIGRQGTGDVLAVVVLNGASHSKLATDGSEVRDAIQRVNPVHHAAVQVFLQGATLIDFVEFDTVFDLRTLNLSWKQLFAALGVQGPNQMQSAPQLVKQGTPAASRLLSLCGAAGVIRRNI
jgi:hypothetical protein